MNITSAQYTSFDGETTGIKILVDDKTIFVPLSEGNRYYREIMRQVEAGDLTIADAD